MERPISDRDKVGLALGYLAVTCSSSSSRDDEGPVCLFPLIWTSLF